jgi:hypothetical protein
MTFKIKIATWNANGIINKIDETKTFLMTEKIDIMIINETKLTSNDKLYFNNYKTYRQDRPTNTRAGGVAIIIKSDIAHRQIKNDNTNSIETVTIELANRVAVTAAYNRPENKFTESDLKKLFERSRKVIVGGDFNAKHGDWNRGRSNANGNLLKKYTDDNDLTVNYTDEPTHFPENGMSPTTIDLFITKNITINRPTTLTALNSDHNPVIITTDGQYRENRSRTKITYKNTDWNKFRETIDSQLKINRTITDRKQLEHTIDTLTQIIQNAIKKHTKTHTINTETQHITPEIIQLIKKKNATRKSWQRTGNPIFKEQAKNLAKEIKTRIQENKNKIWQEKIEKLNIKDNSLFKIAKLLKKPKEPIGIIKVNDTLSITDKEKADTLASFYRDVHDLQLNTRQLTTKQKEINHIAQVLQKTNYKNTRQYDRDNLTDPTEILTIIKSLPNNKAPGPDNIPNKAIKNLSKKTIVQLHYIINAIIQLQHFPQQWKIATIIPIPKPKKDLTNPNNYRPISLLPGLAKVAEKVINARLNKYDKNLKLTREEQFGFRQGHDTTQQVTRIVNDIITNYNKKKVTAMTLLDIQKAFDRVWIQGLIIKLYKNKIPINMVKLLQSYLTDRKFRVKIENTLSETQLIKAGVPQGSVLGPRLFTWFINDIPTFAKTKLALYADDTAIYAHSFNGEVANRQVQLHLNMILKYFDEWLITINANKTETILFTRKSTNSKIITKLKVKDKTIATTPTVKYLGLTLDTRLNFHTHINNTLTKANATLRQIYPLMARNNKMTIDNKKRLYKTIIRPIITYASPAWCHIPKTTMIKPQRFQNKCLRLATNMGRYTKITDLHETAQIETLKEHIDRLSNNFYHNRTQHNTLTKDMTKLRKHNTTNTIKHKLPHMALDIFNEPNTESQ